MTLKEISRYTELRTRLLRAEEMLESLREASRPGSAIIGGTQGVTEAKDKVGNFIIEIADLTERIKYLKKKMGQEKKRLDKFIDKVVDERIRMAFRLKFVHDLTQLQTAETLGENYTADKLKK